MPSVQPSGLVRSGNEGLNKNSGFDTFPRADVYERLVAIAVVAVVVVVVVVVVIVVSSNGSK